MSTDSSFCPQFCVHLAFLTFTSESVYFAWVSMHCCSLHVMLSLGGKGCLAWDLMEQHLFVLQNRHLGR